MDLNFELGEKKPIIFVPAEQDYVEILGYKFDRCDNFEDFLEYLNGLERMKTNWEELRKYLKDYREEKIRGNFRANESLSGRYCVALSITDILNKMDEIEKKS